MKHLLHWFMAPVSCQQTELALCCLRIAIGFLTVAHGYPKIMGGIETWANLGTFVRFIGISFWPVIWGFLGACTEFFGGIALIFGFGTRIASACLSFMMFVAYMYHRGQGDDFNAYSLALTSLVIYLFFFWIGGGTISSDYAISSQEN